MLICVSKLTKFGSNNGLWSCRRQAIIWTNAGILLIRTLGTIFSKISSEIRVILFKKMHFKMASILSRSQCVNSSTEVVIVKSLHGVGAWGLGSKQLNDIGNHWQSGAPDIRKVFDHWNDYHITIFWAEIPLINLSLQWRYMSAMVSQITGYSTACSTACWCWQQINITAPPYWSFVSESTGDPCYDVSML